MITATFSKPPSDQKGATLYQHAKATLRLAREAAEKMQSYDNKDSVDVNSNAGTIVTARPLSVNLTANLAGALKKEVYTSMHGQMTNGSLEADLRGSSYEAARLTLVESDASTQVTLKNSPGNGYGYTPGTISVIEDKATGGLTIEQESEFPWTFDIGPGVADKEAKFAASGPTSTADVNLYHQGVRVEQGIRKEMSSLKALDGTPQDLNPQPGLVVLAGQGSTNSNNLVHNYMAGDYPVPTEACLKFDPQSGEIASYARGFGEHVGVAYSRSGDKEIFETNSFLNFNRVEIETDGSRLHQEFQSTYAPKLAGLFQSDSEIETALMPRLLNSKGLLASGGTAIGAGALAAAFAGGPIGLAVGALTAGLALAYHKQDIQLNYGVNRFPGSDSQTQFAEAQKTFNSCSGETVTFDKAPADRETCRKFIAAADRNYGNIQILTDKFGDSGRPAVAIVPLGLSAPLRLQEGGVELPGGQVIAFESIRSIKDTSRRNEDAC
jgi:hypothetical protein